ncbi:hypothetical protein CROQUDRAFT_655402 [Cronartium quercuum f. sp. fusiforme G11]|uniref:Uncharacterized protein n=1 Tax=Cronartium quercuum f. sp. fusiforme G11 TaxID=708437 RepID=A0A9P6NL86_9BASI|nr:hypothetical protein CROQUDRAFT_655402 [Cronartium quercuum f. sp. fusiforme G11]
MTVGYSLSLRWEIAVPMYIGSVASTSHFVRLWFGSIHFLVCLQFIGIYSITA